jgi:hypothetical protein
MKNEIEFINNQIRENDARIGAIIERGNHLEPAVKQRLQLAIDKMIEANFWLSHVIAIIETIESKKKKN